MYVKIVNTSEEPKTLRLNFTGLRKKQNILPQERVRFCSGNLYEDNDALEPERFVPVREAFRVEMDSPSVEVTLPPYCFDVCIFELQ